MKVFKFGGASVKDASSFRNGNQKSILEEIKKYHFGIIKNLFSDFSHSVYKDISEVFLELEKNVNRTPLHSYNQEYDQIVSVGEILSSKIVSAYLNEFGVKNYWMDVRNVVKTDNTYREGKVNWELTEELVKE